MMNSPVYIFNTEALKRKLHFADEYFLLPAGFMDAYLLNWSPSKITYYDFNPNALNFKRTLIEQWDCTKTQLWEIVSDLKYPYALSDFGVPNFHSLTLKEQFDAGWDSFVFADWIDRFHAVKGSDVSYVLFDLVNNPMLCGLVEKSDTRKYMWFSNCFDYAHGDSLGRQRKSYEIFRKAAKRHGLFLHGLDPIVDNFIWEPA